MNTLTVKEKISEDLIPALVSGALSLVGYNVIFGNDPFGQIKGYPAYLVVGGTVFGSHLVGNVLEDHVLNLFQSNRTASIEGALAKPVISGLSTYGIMASMISPETRFINSFALGAGSVAAGGYLSEHILGLKKN